MHALIAWVRLDLRRRARSLGVLALLVALATAHRDDRGGRCPPGRARRWIASSTRTRAGHHRGAPQRARLRLGRGRRHRRCRGAWPGSRCRPADRRGRCRRTRRPTSPTPTPSIMDTIERPVVLDGRLADPTRDDEVVVTRGFEGTYGRWASATPSSCSLFTPQQMDANGLGSRPEGPAGPASRRRIVGVVRSPWFSDTPGVEPEAGGSSRLRACSPGTRTTWLGDGGCHLHQRARAAARRRSRRCPTFREQLAEVSGRRDIEFFDLVGTAEHANEVGDFEANSLLAFAAGCGDRRRLRARPVGGPLHDRIARPTSRCCGPSACRPAQVRSRSWRPARSLAGAVGALVGAVRLGRAVRTLPDRHRGIVRARSWSRRRSCWSCSSGWSPLRSCSAAVPS